MLRLFTILCVAFLISPMTFGDTLIPIGFISWNVTSPGSTTGEFDISNETGPNASVFPDTSFPVITSVNLELQSFELDLPDGEGHEGFNPSAYFTLAPDGLSFTGSTIGVTANAILTGTLTPLAITENDGSVHNIYASFSATILPSSGETLNDGDFAIIYATPVPEPAFVSWTLLGIFFLSLVAVRKRAALNLG